MFVVVTVTVFYDPIWQMLLADSQEDRHDHNYGCQDLGGQDSAQDGRDGCAVSLDSPCASQCGTGYEAGGSGSAVAHQQSHSRPQGRVLVELPFFFLLLTTSPPPYRSHQQVGHLADHEH